MNRKLFCYLNKFYNFKANTLKKLNKLKIKIMKVYRNKIKTL